MHKKILVLGLLLVSMLTSVSFGLVYNYSRNDVSLPDDGFTPKHIAYDSTNNLICVLTTRSAGATESKILRYLPDGTWASETTPSIDLAPKDIAIDSVGNIFNLNVSAIGPHIKKFAIDGSWLMNIGAGTLVLPVDIAINGANLYVLDCGDRSVKKYSTSSGRLISSWTSPDLAWAAHFTVGNNWAYFVTGSNRILKFPRTGATTPEAVISNGEWALHSIGVGYVESFGVFLPRRQVEEGTRFNFFRYSSNLTSPAILGMLDIFPSGSDIAIKSDSTVIALLLPTSRTLSIYTAIR